MNPRKTSRTCPKCNTIFGAVKAKCICPECHHQFTAGIFGKLMEGELSAASAPVVGAVVGGWIALRIAHSGDFPSETGLVQGVAFGAGMGLAGGCVIAIAIRIWARDKT